MLFNDYQSIADLKALVGRRIYRLTADAEIVEASVRWFSVTFGNAGREMLTYLYVENETMPAGEQWPVEQCFLTKEHMGAYIDGHKTALNRLYSEIVRERV